MANKRIDQLNENLKPLTGSELIPIFDVVNGTTERVDITQLSSYILSGVTDTHITSGSFDSNLGVLSLELSNNDTITVTGFTDSDNFITGGTFNSNTGTLSLVRNDGNTINITGITVNNTSEYTLTTVTLTNNQIKFLNTQPQTLLSAPGTNKYYEGYIIGEWVSDGFYSINGNSVFLITGSWFGRGYADMSVVSSGTDPKVFPFLGTRVSNYDPSIGIQVYIDLNQAVVLTTDVANLGGSGTGTLKLKIYHRTVTFGS